MPWTGPRGYCCKPNSTSWAESCPAVWLCADAIFHNQQGCLQSLCFSGCNTRKNCSGDAPVSGYQPKVPFVSGGHFPFETATISYTGCHFLLRVHFLVWLPLSAGYPCHSVCETLPCRWPGRPLSFSGLPAQILGFYHPSRYVWLDPRDTTYWYVTRSP